MEHLPDTPLAQVLLECLPADGTPLTRAQLLYRAAARVGRELTDVRGVNAHGGFGVWCWDVAFEMAQIRDVLAKHTA